MYKVVIDAGHGGRDNGATFGDRKEKDDVLEMAYLITNILFNCGIETIMTRSDDTFVTLRNRAEIANDIGADLFLSVHRNSSPSGDVSGVEVWVNSKRPTRSVELANNVLDALLMSFDTSRGVNAGYRGDETKDFAVNRLTKMPSVLVEFGFINSEKDNMIFDENKEKIAQDVAYAVLKTLRVPCKQIKERTLTIKDGTWNLRAEPYGTVIGKVFRGETYQYSDYKNGFYKIPMGWVSEQGVILNEPDEAPIDAGDDYMGVMANYSDEGHFDNYEDEMVKDVMSHNNADKKMKHHQHYSHNNYEQEIDSDLESFMGKCCDFSMCEEKPETYHSKMYEDKRQYNFVDRDEYFKMVKSTKTIKVKKGIWNIRKSPYNGVVMGVVYGHQIYTYEGISQGWYKVNNGYLSPIAVENMKDDRSVIKVKNGKWNVKRMPDLESEIIRVVGGKQMLECYGKENDFYLVDGGYIHKDCIMY